MSIRVATWNVHYAAGAEKNRRRLELMTGLDADVWVLTETNDQLDLSRTHEALRAEQRYVTKPGGRWVTAWSRLPITARLPTDDPSRTVAALVDAGVDGPICIYGTVLPWQHDAGPTADARGWSEFYRVTPEQGAEWHRLRVSHPDATLVVAGDLNHNLGGRHYYGTVRGRALLRETLAAASLTCLTEADRFPFGQLLNPPIDHVCAGAGAGRRIEARVQGWERRGSDGIALSDHSGVLVEVRIS